MFDLMELFQLNVWQNELRKFCHDTTFSNPKGRSIKSLAVEFEQEILSFQDYEQSQLETGEFSFILKIKKFLESGEYKGESHISYNSLCRTINLNTPLVKFLCISIIDTYKILIELVGLKNRVDNLRDFQNIQEQIKITEEKLGLHVQAYYQWKSGIIPSYMKKLAELALNNNDNKPHINTPQNTDGIPNYLTDDQLRKLHCRLFSKGLIEEENSDIFISSIRQGNSKLNWLGTVQQLSLLFFTLKQNKENFPYRGVWEKVALIFTIKGEAKSKHHIESTQQNISEEAGKVIREVLRGI